jgi:simple sugar transport system permease protein
MSDRQEERTGASRTWDAIVVLLRLKPSQKLTRDYLVSLCLAVGLALLAGAGIMLLCGVDPLKGYEALVQGALGRQRAFGNTLAKTVTFCLTGLAMAVAAKAGVFNVGGEGQLFLGAMAAAVVGARLAGSPLWLVTVLSLLAALAAGALYALLPAVLKVKWKVDEVITTIMLNSVAIYFCGFLANGPLKTAERGIASGTDSIAAGAGFAKLIPLSNLTTGVFYAAVAALFIWYLMSRSTIGFEMRLTGENDRFARYCGIRADRLMIWGMVISGALCGLVGMLEIFGLHNRFLTTVSNEFYFDGMLVAMIMRYNPFGIILMSFFFAILSIGSKSMELTAGISSELILIVQSIIIFFMAAEGGIREMWTQRAIRRKSRRQARLAGKETAP